MSCPFLENYDTDKYFDKVKQQMTMLNFTHLFFFQFHQISNP